MNYDETVNFIKLLLLLMNGGTFILRTLIYKLISESGRSLDDLLLQSRDLFEDKLKKNRKQLDLLFPGNNQNADIEQWDVSLLTLVLLNPFKGLFDSEEIAAITFIRDQRNKILAHNATSEMTLKDFVPAWKQVSGALTKISTRLSSEDQSKLIFIESSIYQDPFRKDIAEQFKENGRNDSLVQNVVEHVMPLVNEKILDSKKRFEDVFRRIEKLEKEKDMQGKKIALLAKMQVNTGSARSKRQVQEHILEASNNFISKDPDVNMFEDEVESAVEDLFNGMEELGVKVKKADKGSILLTILCPTIKCLRDILVYIDSPQIKHKLTDIEKAVDKYHACETRITIDIDLHSLETTINRLEEELEIGAVYLTLECSGTWGVKNAFQMFENGESTNTLNNLSEALSHRMGENVELHTSIDKDKLEDDIEKEKERKEDDERQFREKKQYFERTNRFAEERRDMKQYIKEKLEKDMKKSVETRELTLEKYFRKGEKGKEEDERKIKLAEKYFEGIKQVEVYIAKHENHFKRLQEIDQQLLVTLSEMEVLVRNRLLPEKQYGMKAERKEDERYLGERQDFQRSIYEKKWNKNKDDLRGLIEKRLMAEEPLEKKPISNERIKQLLKYLFESDMSGYEFFTKDKLEEYGAVITKLYKQLVDELEILQGIFAIQRQRQQIFKQLAGAAVGGAIGLTGGPVGMLIGGAIGLYLGGLFGKID